MIWETVILALRAIRRNTLRSVLTILGVVIGVAAVIAMVTVGSGTSARIVSDISKLGSNLLVIRPGQGFGPGGPGSTAKSFTDKDAVAIADQVAGARAVAPAASKKVTVILGNQNWTTTLSGTDNGYFITRQWNLVSGRQFSDGELRGGSAVCIIGQTVRRNLFGSGEAIGQSFRLQSIPCKVIGILETKGQSGFGQDQDDVVLMPLRTYQTRLAGSTDVQLIFVSARDGVATSKVQKDIQNLMHERRRISEGAADDFNVQDVTEISNTLSTTTSVLTGLLSAVAAISLLVGGIGIMNIMLVSVTERTREIGIRLAVGALRRQVLAQFLIEAVVLSIFGGILGIGLGLVLAALGGSYLSIPFILNLPAVALAFLFSAFVGVMFGFFPARRAANLNPIEALRHE